MTPPDLKVVTLFDSARADDMAAKLRQSADNIDAETDEFARTTAIIMVQVNEDGQVKAYGWGKTDRFHALGVLAAAQIDLCGGVE